MNKFFNNITHKNKVFCFSSLLLATSVVCPLTSCGSDNTSNDIGGFDKEFGFDAQTYNNLERQFTSKYGAYLKGKFLDNNEFENKFNNFLQNDLTILRNKLFDQAQNYSFTFRTNTLIDYASKNFNINLNRNANVSDIDFDNLKQSSLENFVIYMENMEFDEVEIDKEKAKFNNKFDEILENCKSKTDDNAKILMQLRADVIDCWQNLDDEFAYLSAYNHLKKFFDEYEFKVKDQSENLKDSNDLLWDNLLKKSAFIGENNIGKINQDINHPIADDWIRNLFTISRKSDESEKKEDKDTPANNNSLVETNSYSKEIIPGFILTPVLKTMSQNIFSNEYYMNIDWQLMYAKYQDKDQKTIDKVTAHLATAKDEKALDYDDFKDGQLPSDSYQFTKYSLKATPKYQQEKMFEAYFDQTKEPNQKITFSWNKDMFGIEYFLPSDAKSDNFEVPTTSYKVPMARNNLSLIGLQLNGTNLSDLLNKKTNLKNDQSVSSVNYDDNLGIEEKFVKYCDINTIANVSFSNNDIGKNTIQNSFTASFTNSNNIQYNVETKSNMNNIQPSKNFFNNAINFYKQVVDYVDTGKILNITESRHWTANVIQFGLWVLIGIMVFLSLCTILRYIFYFHGGKPIVNRDKIMHDLICSFIHLTLLGIATLILFLVWKFTITDPISDEVNKIRDWNNKITNRSTSSPDDQINVIDKINGDDKEIFKSIDNFMHYYKKNSNTAFASYFYYFHFAELSQRQTNNEQSTTLDEKVKNDYDNFNNTKKEFNINDREYGGIVIAIISLVMIFIGLFIVSFHIILTLNVIYNYLWNDGNNVEQNIDNNIQNVLDGMDNEIDQLSDASSVVNENNSIDSIENLLEDL